MVGIDRIAFQSKRDRPERGHRVVGVPGRIERPDREDLPRVGEADGAEGEGKEVLFEEVGLGQAEVAVVKREPIAGPREPPDDPRVPRGIRHRHLNHRDRRVPHEIDPLDPPRLDRRVLSCQHPEGRPDRNRRTVNIERGPEDVREP